MQNPACHEKCPGCKLYALSQPEILVQKEKWLRNKLSDWAERLDTIRLPDPSHSLNYRNRICLSTIWDQGKWAFGLVRGTEIISLHHCPVHSEKIRKSVNLFVKNLSSGMLFPLVYYVQAGSQVTLIVKQKKTPDTSWLDEEFINNMKRIGIEGLWLHLNPGAGRNVFAKNYWHLLWGTPRSIDSNEFIYGPRSFQQLLPSLYQQSLDQSQAFLAPGSDDLVIDLYCGIGTGLARWISCKCHSIGVETNGEAVECAQKNAPSAVVLRGKCKDRIPQLSDWIAASKTDSRQLLYVNPPRTGMELEVLEWVVKGYKPQRIVYLSCSAGTLRRDLNALAAAGYRIIKITPYDFFPQTIHLETLSLLERDI